MSGTQRPTVAIRVSTDGSDQARAKLEQLGRDGAQAMDRLGRATDAAAPATARLGSAVDALANRYTAVAAAAIAAGGAVARAGDQMVATLGRLQAATGSTAAARDVFESLTRLSQQTGVSVAETAGAFGRFRVAAGEIGATNAQVLKLVEGLQKAAIVGGASGQESAAAMQQLGQALASGRLQGDELRSVLENMPQLAQALARELGVGVGQLRQMGADGKLTADTVFPALLRASERMTAEFDRLPPTMSRAFDILGSSMTAFVARLDEALGLSRGIAAAVTGAASVLQAVTPGTPLQRAEARYDTLSADLSAARGGAPVRSMFPAGAAGDRLFASARANYRPGSGHPGDVATIEGQLVLAGRAVFEERSAYADLQVAESERASGQATEAARQRASEYRKELVKDLDKRTTATEKLAERQRQLGEMERSGGIATEEIARLRKLALEDYQETIDKLAPRAERAAKAMAEEANAHVTAWRKANDEAGKAADRLAERAREAAQREAEQFRDRSLNAVAGTFERAFDRVGDAIAQAFLTGQGAAVNFGNVARSVVGSLASDFLKLGVINPISNSIFGGTARPTLGGAGVGLGDLFSLSGLLPKDGILSSLGLGGIGSTVLIPGITQTTSAALGAMGGAYGPASLAQLSAAGSLAPGMTLGGFLGGAGLGFGAGSLLNSLIGGNQLGGTVGSGLGSAAGAAIGSFIPGVGTLIGGLIGGLAGGGLGGLFGPGESVRGYGYRVTGAGAAGIAPLDYTYYNDSGRAEFQRAEQAIAAINQYVAARRLSVEGSSIVGGTKDGPDYTWGNAGNFNEGFRNLRFSSVNDNELTGALAGRAFGSPEEFQQFVDGWSAVRDTIRDLTDTAQQKLARQLEAVNDQFDQLAAKAREYGLSEAGLAAARERALAAVREQQSAEARGILAGLAYGPNSALAPEQQYFAALTSLRAAGRELEAGGSVSSYAAVAGQVLPVARGFLGTSTRYAAITAEVAQTVARAGGDPNGMAALLAASANGIGSLESTFAAYGERQVTVASATLSEIRRLAASLEALIARQKAA